jgi:hypothetical protein
MTVTSDQIRELALRLYTVVLEREGGAELAVWQRCLRTCHSGDMEPPMAMLISEALTDYLYDGSRPQTRLVTPLAKATAVLPHTTGGAPDGEPLACPARARLTPSAIAVLIEWVLAAGDKIR